MLQIIVFAAPTQATETLQPSNINPARAKFNYQMFCQGCHTANGEGGKSVPNLNGNIGYFLRSQVGREYLIRVPGSSNSALNNTDLTEVLNWMIVKFSGDSLTEAWRPFDAKEVEEYRQNPLFEVVNYRRELMADIHPDS